MRIAYVNETAGGGSIGRMTAELAQRLSARGHTCRIYYASGTPRYADVRRIGTTADHKIHAVLSRLTGRQGCGSRLATERFVRDLLAFAPDVVHLQNLHANYLHLPAFFRALAGAHLPVVLTLHDGWFYTGKCTYPIASGCEKYRTGCGHCPQLFTDSINPTFFFDRTARCLADKARAYSSLTDLTVVGVSDWVTEQARFSILAPYRPVTILNFVDDAVFHPVSGDLRARLGLTGKFVVLAVASLFCTHKGYGELCDLAASLPEEYAIVAVGRTEKPFPPRVVHIPHTDSAEELAALYSMADVCLNATRYETFGMVTAEALCCGTPVVVYANTATQEMVTPDVGIAVPDGAGAPALWRALATVKSRGKSAYTAACLAAAPRFSLARAVTEHEELYRAAVHRAEKSL